jgi:hypothetical protein
MKPYYLILLLLIGTVRAGEGPAIDPLVWKFPHEIVWTLADGAVWWSVGHTATVLTIVPEADAVTVAVHGVTRFGADGLPAALTPLVAHTFRATAADAAAPKQGLHRKTNGYWDFNFGKLPPAPYTQHHRLFFAGSPRFRYCLTFHLSGETTGDGRFAQLQLAALVAELLDDPALPTTLSWPAGQPMPRGLVPVTDWSAKESPPAPWAADFPRRGPFAEGRCQPAQRLPAYVRSSPALDLPTPPNLQDDER